MAKETKILKLYQVTRPEDDDKAFNIQTMLNDNWDKIDKAFEKASTAEAEEGTNSEKIMTPKTTKDAILKLAPQLEYKAVTNLSATPSGVISWTKGWKSQDNTLNAFEIFRATKDISNYDYQTCQSDASLFADALTKEINTYTNTGLTNNTKYWFKIFTRYVVAGDVHRSNGVTVTFTTPAIKIAEFYNAGNEFTAITGGWVAGYTYGSFVRERKSDNLYIRANGVAGDIGVSTIVTGAPINITNLKTLKMEVTSSRNTTSGYLDFSTGASSGLPAYQDLSKVTETTANPNRHILELDVTSVTGNYYIKVDVACDGSGNYEEANIYRVWGES